VISLFWVIVMKMNADDTRGEAAEMLGVVNISQPVFGCSVSEVVPVAKGGCGKAGEDHLPEIVRRNFAWIFAAF
jgi:hypothetical protein